MFIANPIRPAFIDQLQLARLTLLHSIRILVEIILFWLAAYQTIPETMTFHGRNYDILAGLTAPLIYYFGFVKSQLSRRLLIGWNFVCLGLLTNVVITGILSAPSPIQQLAFEQPNIAILYFPFSWLPSTVVPIVLLAHLASLRRLFSKGQPEIH